MIVMMITITPSLKAAKRSFPILNLSHQTARARSAPRCARGVA
jgi:hypothetical protein